MSLVLLPVMYYPSFLPNAFLGDYTPNSPGILMLHFLPYGHGWDYVFYLSNKIIYFQDQSHNTPTSADLFPVGSLLKLLNDFGY